MSEIKYIVRPGYVISANDSDRHFITGRRLIDLYDVDWRECVIENTGIETRGLHGEFTVLTPQHFVENYTLENCSKVEL